MRVYKTRNYTCEALRSMRFIAVGILLIYRRICQSLCPAVQNFWGMQRFWKKKIWPIKFEKMYATFLERRDLGVQRFWEKLKRALGFDKMNFERFWEKLKRALGFDKMNFDHVGVVTFFSY